VQGRTVLITGGSSGIGWALSEFFAIKGWNVCIVDVQEPVRFLKGMRLFKADIRDIDKVKIVIEKCIREFGGIDALINNAGKTDKNHRRLLDIPYETWRDIISTNINGTFACLRSCAETMKERGRGNIVNITSLLAQRGFARIGDAVYSTSKAALEMLTECASVELLEYGINVNSAYPGVPVNTGFFDYLSTDERAKLAEPTIMNELVYTLCNLEPGEVTGRSFSVTNWLEDSALLKARKRAFAE